MIKPSQKELIKDSHKRLANHYFKWSLLLLDYSDNLYKKGEKMKPEDSKKLKQNPEYGHEILKKIINEDFSLTIKGRSLDNVNDSTIEYDIQMEFEAQYLDKLPEDFKAFVKSIGKEKNAAVACLVGFDRDEREGLDLEYGSSFYESAYEHRMLSIIYDNYEEIVKILQTDKIDIENPYHLIELYRNEVVRECGALTGFWMLNIKGVKFHRGRIGRGDTVKKKKKADRKQPVIEAYYRIKTGERQKMTKNKIATTIRKDLDKILREPPSLSTIKRYLEEENLI